MADETILAQTTEQVPATPSQGDGGAPGSTAAPASAPVTFTPEQQAEIDRILGRRLSEDRQRRGSQQQPSSPWLDFGQQIESHPEADRLRAELQEVVSRAYNIDPGTAAARQVDQTARSLELRIAEVELRATDPTFKAHEQEVRDYADRAGIRVDSPAMLRVAYDAWKGTNATQIAAEAQVAAQRAAQAAAAAKQNGQLASGGTAQQPAKDYRKMTDAEIYREIDRLPWD